MAVVARAEYSTGRHREALDAAKASGRWPAVLQRQADGAEEQALIQIERDFVTAPLTRDMAYFESRTIRDVRPNVFGDAAIVNMAAESKGTCRREPFSEQSRGVAFFVKRHGRWQVLNSQMTTIKK